MVDTGAAHSMIPDSLLSRLGMKPIERDEYILADGSSVEYGWGLARFAISGRELPCPVTFGPEDEFLLGATTLENFSFMADPVGKRLVRTPRPRQADMSPALHMAIAPITASHTKNQPLTTGH